MASSPISIIFFCVFLVQVTLGQIPTYTCDILEELFSTEETPTCCLNDVRITAAQSHFKIEPNHTVTEIEGFWVQGERFEVLTSDVCETLSYITRFVLWHSSLTTIDGNAFEKCTKLQKVTLSHNALTSIPSRLFASNIDLTMVKLNDNKFAEIDEDLFKDNPNLEIVDLAKNSLTSLSPNMFKYNLKLKELILHDNQLSDLSFLDGKPILENFYFVNLQNNKLTEVNVEKLFMKVPNLNIINLLGNNFGCNEQEEIKRLLDEKKMFGVNVPPCLENMGNIKPITTGTQLGG